MRTVKLVVGTAEICFAYMVSFFGAFGLMSHGIYTVLASIMLILATAITMIATRNTRGSHGDDAIVVMAIIGLVLSLIGKNATESNTYPNIYIAVHVVNAFVAVFSMYGRMKRAGKLPWKHRYDEWSKPDSHEE